MAVGGVGEGIRKGLCSRAGSYPLPRPQHPPGQLDLQQFLNGGAGREAPSGISVAWEIHPLHFPSPCKIHKLARLLFSRPLLLQEALWEGCSGAALADPLPEHAV